MRSIVFFFAPCLLLGACRENREDRGFYSVPSSHTNITFRNTLTQTEYFNIIEYLYFYNGGGVAAGDIDNDGLVDLFFTANQFKNKLYRNKGNFIFEDISDSAGVTGKGNWSTGVAMADVNADGLLDIYVCGVGNYKYFNGLNQLLINNGDLTFSDQTKEYGLSFQGFSTHAVFFDYDNDGDLDLYLLNHSVHSTGSYGDASLRSERDSLAGDKLYRNDLIPAGRNGFTDVTSSAGIYNSQIGYGLGVGVSDVNMDGFMDIYVSNDFHENDYLYINERDGTFREQIREATEHVSRFSMGNDITDINNDGLPDVVTLDMLPRDEEIIKSTAGEDSYEIYTYKLNYGYHHQFARNCLQLNRGVTDKGQVLFSDVAAVAGVHASDWSWAPLVADFDNDGHKDLFIANGIVTRPNDLDYINFISTDSAQRFYNYKDFINRMPSGAVPNIFFRNTGKLKFEDVSEGWIGLEPCVSTGAAYADLDNDGDLDLVVNNVNSEATVYRNDLELTDYGWLQVELKGHHANTFGIGAKVMVYTSAGLLFQEQTLSRGWQSSVSPTLHFGIGDATYADSVVVVWPDSTSQVRHAVARNQRITFDQDLARPAAKQASDAKARPLLTMSEWEGFVHKENEFNAFGGERMIPHMLSTQGPAMATGDVNGDGLEDFFVGGAKGQPGGIFIQDRLGNFKSLLQPVIAQDSMCEDVGSVFFDADNNGTLDLMVVSGGQELPDSHPNLLPRLYLNNGSGIFIRSTNSLPNAAVNASVVRPEDFDRDGDLDVFIGGRVITNRYGYSPQSFLLVNDGNGAFSDRSDLLISVAEGRLGMVADAVWSDVNGDEKSDLIVVGEWMPITVLLQGDNGQFLDKTANYGLSDSNGWWNTITAADFDNDGDEDFVVGNLGWNSRLKASKDHPVTLYAGDIDLNGGVDHLLSYYNDGEEHPFISRDQLVKQVPSLKRQFLRYNNFKTVKREQIISSGELDNFIVSKAQCFSSLYIENRNTTFIQKPLPDEAQFFPLFSFSTGDFNADGIVDLIGVGNLWAVQPDFGRYDGGYGTMLLGDGLGNFQPVRFQSSGFLVRGEGRRIAKIVSYHGEAMYLVARNNDSLLMFK